MPNRRRAVLTTVLLGLMALLGSGLLAVPTAQATAPAVSVQNLHFKVTVGPDDDKVCGIVGDVYLPDEASSTQRVPAVLTTNGFGGSKDDQAGIGAAFAERGYAVLSYSGLGFGGSSCKITLDHPQWDGKAGRQLVSYLAGADGIAYLDAEHTQPAPTLDVVRLDGPGDPRVGTLGGSYGGGFQFATASVDPRVDTLVPLITWNDLSYSLGPNNTGQRAGVSTDVPGAAKLIWGLGLSAFGMTGDLQNGQVPPDVLPCPNFADYVCPTMITAGTTGYLLPQHVSKLREASIASYLERVDAPVLLVQGQYDTLFNLNEAVATYEALQAQGTEVKMIWQSWGHSGGSVPGELDLDDPDPNKQYITARVLDWLEHYLQDAAVDTGPEFAYFRDWVDYTGSARPAYAHSARFPVGDEQVWRLSGDGTLVTGDTPTVRGGKFLLTTAAGAPTSFNEADVLGNFVEMPSLAITDLPGTFGAWTSSALAEPVDVAGIPRVRLRVQAPTAALTQNVGPAGKLVLFLKLADVAPDGSATLIKAFEAPVRVPDVREPFTVTLPGIVHRFAEGHRLRLMVAGGSINYRAGLTPVPVTIAGGDGQTLSLPVVD